jgi:hypothetical protein
MERELEQNNDNNDDTRNELKQILNKMQDVANFKTLGKNLT